MSRRAWIRLALALCSAVCGCGGDGGTPETPDRETPAGEVPAATREPRDPR